MDIYIRIKRINELNSYLNKNVYLLGVDGNRRPYEVIEINATHVSLASGNNTIALNENDLKRSILEIRFNNYSIPILLLLYSIVSGFSVISAKEIISKITIIPIQIFPIQIYASLFSVILFQLAMDEVFEILKYEKNLIMRLLRNGTEATLFILGFGFSYEHLPLYCISFLITLLFRIWFRQNDWYYKLIGGIILGFRS